MRGWIPLTIPLNKGLDETGDDAITALDAVGFKTATNLDFGLVGSIRGRPGIVRVSGFVHRGLSAAGGPLNGGGTTTTLAATGYTPLTIVGHEDRLGSHPMLVARGRTWTLEQDGIQTAWMDRLGGGSATVSRMPTYSQVPPDAATLLITPTTVPAVADDFGVSQDGSMGLGAVGAIMLSNAGTIEAIDTSSATFGLGMGTGARCGANTATISVAAGSNNLVFGYRLNKGGSYVAVTIAADALTPTGFGTAPVICCDYDATNYWVVYWSTTANNFKILRVSTTGAVLTNSGNINAGGAAVSLWVTNTSNATNRIVVTYCRAALLGVTTQVYNATTLATIGIDTTYNPAGLAGHTAVCGVAQAGEAWIVFRTANGATNGVYVIKRSLTAATLSQQIDYIPSIKADVTPVNAAGNTCMIVHQPVLVSGRVIIGLAFAPATINYPLSPCSWFSLDYTDVWQASTTTGSVLHPYMLARGPDAGTHWPLNPVSATISTGVYWFPTIDYADFAAPSTSGFLYVGGVHPEIAINKVTLSTPQACRVGESTILSGSVPHEFSGGYVRESGFPLGAPAMATITRTGAAGTLPAGSYSAIAVYRYTDEMGQLHQSLPSPIKTINGVLLNDSITLACAPYQLSEREYDNIYVDFYLTVHDPVAGALHYLVGSKIHTAATLIVTAEPGVGTATTPLYSDGNTMPNTPIRAGGGCATVGTRCWVANGQALYASKLTAPGIGAAWNDQGPLVVNLPASSGDIMALEELDGQLVVFCAYAVYMVNGPGPDDVGTMGSGTFSDPVRVAKIGCPGATAVVGTPRGVLFWATNSSTPDGHTGGLWLVDRSGTISQVSHRILNKASANTAAIPKLAYVREREMVGLTLDVLGVGANSTLFTWDLRANQWSSWTTAQETTKTIGSAGGVLWACGAEPYKYTGPRGTDVGTASATYNMSIVTNDIPADNTNGMGWGRVRSISVLGHRLDASDHTVTMDAVLDNLTIYNSATISMTAAASGTSWPTDRYLLEFILPQQKCASVAVTILGTANVVWTALELQTKPTKGRTPPKWRV